MALLGWGKGRRGRRKEVKIECEGIEGTKMLK
jgi:hypothetical protein